MEKDILYFAKIRSSATIPTKKKEDAGYDMYADFEGDYFVIEPGKTKAIPTGIATAFDSKYYAQIEERSSMAKLGIKKSGGVFDSGYRGEYFIMTYNTNDKPFVISLTEPSGWSEQKLACPCVSWSLLIPRIKKFFGETRLTEISRLFDKLIRL